MSKLKVDILLPYKEKFNLKNSGAIANIVYELVNESNYKNTFRIFGSEVDKPLLNKNFVSLNPKFSLFKGKNIGFALSYLDYLEKTKSKPNILEIHNRSQIVFELLKKRNDLNVVLYYHNDPRTMKGSILKSDREWLLKNLKGIICVSDYIKNCFLDNLSINSHLKDKVVVVRNGVKKLKINIKKKNQILIVGRMIPEKGILEACKALANILPEFPDWSLALVGAKNFHNNTKKSDYEKEIKKTLEPINKQVKIFGHLQRSKLNLIQKTSMISIVPSLWEEPAGLTVLEALAAKSALITTNKGGISEVAKGNSIIIDVFDTDKNYNRFVNDLSFSIKTLLTDDKKLRSLQSKAYSNFKYTNSRMATYADKARLSFLK